MKILRFPKLLPISFLLLTSVIDSSAATFTLTTDVEYNGAIMDSKIPVVINDDGRLNSGTLKEDYQINGLVFSAGKNIVFCDNGQVKTGYLKLESAINNLVFSLGEINFYYDGTVSSGKLSKPASISNLFVTEGVNVNLAKDGTVLWLSKPSEFRVLNHYVIGDVKLSKKNDTYLIASANFTRAQLIATFIHSKDAFGSSLNTPIILQGSVNMRLNEPTDPSDGISSVIWIANHTQNFVFNNMNFGRQPQIFVKGNRIEKIKIQTDITINGVKYNAQSFVWLTPYGKIAD